MSTQTSPLTAALDAIEETAHAALGEEWWDCEIKPLGRDAPTKTVIDSNPSLITYEVCLPEYAAHIAQMDPAFTLRLVEGLREVVEAAESWAMKCPPDDWPVTGGMETVVAADLGRWLLAALTRTLTGDDA